MKDSQSANQKTRFFEGIGESPYREDIQLGYSPLILESDTSKIRTLKEQYIRRRLRSLRSINQIP